MNIEEDITVKLAVQPETKSFNQLMNGSFKKVDLINNIATYIHIICNNAWTLPQPLNQFQAIMITQDLLREFPNFTIEDVVCILKMARTGQFGPTYNRIDPAVFSEWVQKYIDHRLDIQESEYQKTKNTSGSPQRTSSVAPLKFIVEKSKIAPDEKYFNEKP